MEKGGTQCLRPALSKATTVLRRYYGGVILFVAWCGKAAPNVDRNVLPLMVMASFWNVSAAKPTTGRP